MGVSEDRHDSNHISERAELFRSHDPDFADWAAGYGIIKHEDETQVRVYEMADLLVQKDVIQEKSEVYEILAATDRLASAVMWLVVHMTYAKQVRLDGGDMDVPDFKANPDGHTGGALNMAIAYVGYLAANAISGKTRSWLMGQGHCVAAIDAANLLVENASPAHSERYDVSDEGLSRFVSDFYSYKVRPDGRPDSPVGSHVNVHTAGGMMEGGYLGFAELQYVHMPLPGENLVVFLSDGAFEEQRGSDWASRWWRCNDTGIVCPIMIANGRRIDQRTTMSQEGGVDWFRQHLKLNGFIPIDIDGSDPAAYAWAIFNMEENLNVCSEAISLGKQDYPVPLHYTIAEVVKGFGFPGAGTNNAHSLPLGGNPSMEPEARRLFNAGARDLWLPLSELKKATATINNHEAKHRLRERDHALARRQVRVENMPEPPWRDVDIEAAISPMEGIDGYFCTIAEANPGLQVRVGNPDEMSSNRMTETLKRLKHRVTDPESGAYESTDGKIITALNEEAVVCAALGNKGGLNIVVSYEAFATKMLGAIRQELIFARHQRENGVYPGWLSVPVVATSHAWENGKNEQSHQDPSFCEILMGEMSDVSRVVFPPDWNSAIACLRSVYESTGSIWTVVAPKRPVPSMLDSEQTAVLLREGAIRLRGQGSDSERLLLIAVGAYQLAEAGKASDRLIEKGIPHSLIYVLEPGRFREARDELEAACLSSDNAVKTLFPEAVRARIIMTHTRPGPLLGVLRPLDTGKENTRVLGLINHGGTLDVFGMLFANKCTWAHALYESACILDINPEELLNSSELKAVLGKADPDILRDKVLSLKT